jgi:hypothetical protein
MLELYHDWRSFCSMKVRLCLAEKGLSWENRFVDLIKLEHMTPQYLELNPMGSSPLWTMMGCRFTRARSSTSTLTRSFRMFG